MKKRLTKILALTIFGFIFLSTISQAQTTTGLSMPLPDFKEVGGVIASFNSNILQNLVLALSGAAVVVFFFGLVRFILHRSQGKDGDLKKDKEGMLYGLGALFVLMSVWGIITLVQNVIGVNGDENIHIPKICFTANCANTVSNQNSSSPNAFNPGDNAIICASGASYDPAKGKCVTGTANLVNNYNSDYTVSTIANWHLPLKSGSSGDEVAQLQHLLNDKGYNNLEINGSYDLNTQNAVKDFQTKMKLVSTGEVNRSTQDVIIYRVLGTVPDRDEAKALVRDLQIKDTGDDVQALQELLKSFGCYVANTNSDSDGIFGQATQVAVLNFQQHNELYQDGIVGPSTKAVISATDGNMTKCN